MFSESRGLVVPALHVRSSRVRTALSTDTKPAFMYQPLLADIQEPDIRSNVDAIDTSHYTNYEDVLGEVFCSYDTIYSLTS